MHGLSQTTGAQAMVLAGDFNTPPNYPAYHFIKTGKLNNNITTSVEQKTATDSLTKVCIEISIPIPIDRDRVRKMSILVP